MRKEIGKSGRIVRFECPCGWEGEDLLLGRGSAPEFALIESVACTCRGCVAVIHRFLPREGVAPADVEAFAARRGESVRPGELPARALRAIAAEGAAGRVLCPLCRKEELAIARREPPACPVCGSPCRAVEIGSWQ